jgi:hypothetical protein
MAEFIEIISPKAVEDVKNATSAVVTLIEKIEIANRNMIGVKTPSGVDNSIKELNKDYQTLEKQLAKTQQQLDKNRLQEIKLAQAREKAFDKYDAQLAKEQAKLNASANLYNKVQQKLNVLSNEYKALAVQKELTGRLTDKEAQRYDFLQGKIQKYDATLKAVDATMGKYQRNVGNYASGFNVLGNSVNQLTREMPAFTYSVQTGFMALSNNIPIFTDAIGNAIKQNKELAAQGQPTTSVLKQLAGAFLSWGTALSVGITLLTVFGKEIGEFLTGSESKKKALEEETKAIENKNKAEEQARESFARYQSDEISRAKILLENAKNLTLSMTMRTKAVAELQQRYPEYLGNLSKEQILAGDTADAEIRLNDALVKRGIALASQQAIQDEINNGLKAQKWLNDKLNELQTKRLELGSKISKIDPFTRDEEQRARYEEMKLQLENLFYLEGTLKEQYNSKNKIIQDSIKYYLGQYNANAKYIGVVKEETTVTNKNNEAKEKEIELLQNTEAWFEKEIARLKQVRSVTADTTEEYKSYNAQLAILENGLRLLRGEISEFEGEGIKLNLFGDDPAKMFEDWRKGSKENLDEIKTYWEQHGEEIVDLSQELVNTLAEISNAQFQQQYDRLEKERDIAIMFAGESVTAREEIERQYEQRRAVIQRRQAEAEKKMAVFNIITDTAQAIVASLVRDPTGTLAIIIGAIGAAQLGLVLSTPIPQFAKGTDNAPEGWALTQEKGREIITDKSGKVKSLGNDKGAQYTYLNKGDKVFTNTETEAMMFNSNLNNMLLGNGIVMPKVEVSMDTTILGGKIDNLANTIANKDSFTIVRDERGERKYLRKQAETKELLNNVLTYKGIDV